MTCPLCQADESSPYFDDGRRPFLACARCALVFVPESHWPTDADARARYDQHRNDPADPGYRAFLSRPFEAVRTRVPAPAAGLDFGAGPGPTLSVMLEEVGYEMTTYDPFYAPDESVLDRRYDFVTCTEVVEHLQQPATVLRRLVDLLHPGAWLVVMTQLLPPVEAFATWRYRRDQTHIGFYSATTFCHVADMLACRLERATPDVFAFQRPAAP